MAPLEPWEKAMVSEEFLEDVHGQASCVSCHGGDRLAEEKEDAHVGLVGSPDEDAQATCGNCHSEIVAASSESLHVTQGGYYKALYSRTIPENHPVLEEMFGNHCSSCHTTCGDCHISQPNSVGGGFLDGHMVVETPPMTRTCTACHGSRVGNEYTGKNEGYPGDVHFRQGRMNCMACHDGESMHNSMGDTNRYDGEQGPACEDCHQEVGGPNDANVQHTVHGDTLSCQTCHSVAYSSCDSCHVAVSETSGNPYFKTAGTYMTFFIGRNPIQTDERPYEYVPVRHIPIDPENYAYYGDNLLPNFDLLPTWAYSTPHNIQLSTPQNESCNACHGNEEIFLTADKVLPEELAANADVIVESVPEPVPNQ